MQSFHPQCCMLSKLPLLTETPLTAPDNAKSSCLVCLHTIGQIFKPIRHLQDLAIGLSESRQRPSEFHSAVTWQASALARCNSRFVRRLAQQESHSCSPWMQVSYADCMQLRPIGVRLACRLTRLLPLTNIHVIMPNSIAFRFLFHCMENWFDLDIEHDMAEAWAIDCISTWWLSCAPTQPGLSPSTAITIELELHGLNWIESHTWTSVTAC